ncbi:uncharacterized protein [Asterias amurensis]|uniref:uncharacterized protein n=1 Tax=Asterias amurensis TaxID=7602 RepID=UPI003AB1B4CE
MGKKKGTKPRNKNFTTTEMRVLSGFVKANTAELYGKAGHCSQKVEARRQKCWRMAADTLRMAGGPQQREWVDVRKKWNELKVHALKYNNEKNITGGGSMPARNDTYEHVLDALAEQSKMGIHGQDTETDPIPPVDSECSESTEDGSSQENSTSNISSNNGNTMSSNNGNTMNSNNGNTMSSNNSNTTSSNNSNTKSSSNSNTKSSSNSNTKSSSNRNTKSSSNNIHVVKTKSAVHVRDHEIHEELLRVEHLKLDVMRQNLEVQKGMLECLQCLTSSTMFHSMQEA